MSQMLCPRCWGSKIEPKPRDDRNCTYCMGDGFAENIQLSEDFWLEEFVESSNAVRAGLPNDPPNEYVQRLKTLCSTVLQPLRNKFGSICVSSGFRSSAVNKKTGGSKTSAHMFAYAADISPMRRGVKRHQLVDWLIEQPIQYDQAIFEGTWVHVGLYNAAGLQRREAKMMFLNSKGECVFSPYDPKDKRVTL
jgi:zinc D-Ala-D-Ala carboxypeptidase